MAEIEFALIDRLRLLNPEQLSALSLFDRAVDGLWQLSRRQLEDWAAYEHAGCRRKPEPTRWVGVASGP